MSLAPTGNRARFSSTAVIIAARDESIPLTARRGDFARAVTLADTIIASPGVPPADELHAHLIQPKFQYRHKWRVGDLLMWDNCACQHLAVQDYKLPQRRLMHRVIVAGTETV